MLYVCLCVCMCGHGNHILKRQDSPIGSLSTPLSYLLLPSGRTKFPAPQLLIRLLSPSVPFSSFPYSSLSRIVTGRRNGNSTHTYLYTCMCTHICMHTHRHTHEQHGYTYAHMHVQTRVHTQAHTGACAHTHLHIHVCICGLSILLKQSTIPSILPSI